MKKGFRKGSECCPQIERLVLYVENEGCLRIHSYAPLENCLVPFVKKMPRLVTFCLVGFRMDPCAVKQQLLVEVSPDRPTFFGSIWGPISRNIMTLLYPRFIMTRLSNPLVRMILRHDRNWSDLKCFSNLIVYFLFDASFNFESGYIKIIKFNPELNLTCFYIPLNMRKRASKINYITTG